MILLGTFILAKGITSSTEADTPAYVPKSARKTRTQVKISISAWAKSWLKPAAVNLERKAQGWLSTRSRKVQAATKRRWRWPNYSKKRNRVVNLVRMYCILSSTFAQDTNRPTPVHFDTDSRILRIDNCATKSISPCIDDFVSTLLPIPNTRVQGLGGKIGNIMSGTIRWHIEDDQGSVHSITLPNSLYVPQATSRLLSPQHWAQTARDNRRIKRGTWCATYDNAVVLYWDQQKYQRTIPLDPANTNAATIRTAPGFSRFNAFCSTIGDITSSEVYMTYESQMVSDDEDEGQEEDQVESDSEDSEDLPFQREHPLHTDFNLEGPKGARMPTVVEDEEDTRPQDASAEFLRWHHRLGRISPRKIQAMAKQGLLPKKLVDCRVPLCTACLYGKATRRPWRSKTPNNAEETARLLV